MPTPKSATLAIALIGHLRSALHSVSDEEGAAEAFEIGMVVLSSLTGMIAGQRILTETRPNITFDNLNAESLAVVALLREAFEQHSPEQFDQLRSVVGSLGKRH